MLLQKVFVYVYQWFLDLLDGRNSVGNVGEFSARDCELVTAIHRFAHGLNLTRVDVAQIAHHVGARPVVRVLRRLRKTSGIDQSIFFSRGFSKSGKKRK